MITRIWHGKTKKTQAKKYLDFLLNKGTAEYRETPGNLSVKVWQKSSENECHFFTVSEWKDLEAIKRFAGPGYDKAVYYPEDEGVLLEFEEAVKHYETYNVSNSRIKEIILKLNLLMDGGGWLGESFRQKLQGVDESLAFTAPLPQMYCIAALLWNCTYWKRMAIYQILGDHTDRENKADKKNFLPLEELKAQGWEAIKNNFFEAHRELVEVLGLQKDSLLTKEYPPGYNYEFLIEGIIQHDVYHLGQIGYLEKALKTTDNR
jgi:heme-degrading monooxygenase HmoA